MKYAFSVLSLFVSSISFASSQEPARVIRNVAICAAVCNTENFGRRNHGEAHVGTIYYNDATEDNLKNSDVCMLDAKEVEVISDRMSDLSVNTCANALTGKYDFKAVDIYTDVLEDPRDPQGRGMKIKAAKLKK